MMSYLTFVWWYLYFSGLGLVSYGSDDEDDEEKHKVESHSFSSTTESPGTFMTFKYMVDRS